jgi:hypothetical protein
MLSVTISTACLRLPRFISTQRDPQWRASIRYGLETNDPWLPDLVRRADAGEMIIDTIDFSQTPDTTTDDLNEEKVEALGETICRAGDEPGMKSAALLVLIAMLEQSAHPKVVANAAKHIAFTCCVELNVCDIVDAQIPLLESELFAGNMLRS